MIKGLQIKYNSGLLMLKLSAVTASVIIVALGAWHYISLIKNDEYAAWVNHTHEIIETNNELLTNLVSAETGQRGYLATGALDFLGSYYGAEEKAHGLLFKLKTMTRDNPLEQQRIDTMRILADLRFDYLRNGIIEAGENISDSVRLHPSESGKLIMDKFYVLNNKISEDEHLLLSERQEKLKEGYQNSMLLFLTSTFAAAIIMIIAFRGLLLQMRQRFKTEKQLFLNREWFSKTLRSLGDGVIATDEHGIVSFMNEAAMKLTGWSADEATGKPLDYIFDITNETGEHPVHNPIKKALKDRQVTLLSNHTILIRKDKSTLYIDDSAAPVFSDEGNLMGAVLIFRDISEQTLNRKKLIESTNRLRQIIDNTPAIIYILDQQKRFVTVNKAFEETFNVKGMVLANTTGAGMITNEMMDQLITIDHVNHGKRTVKTEIAIPHVDGSFHSYVMVRFSLPDADQNASATGFILTDISEQKKELELRHQQLLHEVMQESEVHYKELADSITDMFYSLDNAERFTFWNGACERQTGKKAMEVIGKKYDEAFPGNSAQEFKMHFKNVFSTKSLYSFSFTGIMNHMNYQARVYPSKRGISILVTDTTSQKKAEREMMLLVQRLQQRNKDLQQFTYVVSHNLRSPIAKIQGLTELFNVEDHDSMMNQTIIQNISAELQNLDHIVTDLNDIITIRDAEHGMKNEEIKLADELKRVTTTLSNEINISGAQIHQQFQVQAVQSIRSYVHSILLNLLSNAIKYRSPERNLEIHVQTQSTEDAGVCLTVEDNGIGINLEKNNSKMFSLYRRFHPAITGRGIGLYMVKSQAESMGGKVEVESVENRGSVFKVYFSKNKFSADEDF